MLLLCHLNKCLIFVILLAMLCHTQGMGLSRTETEEKESDFLKDGDYYDRQELREQVLPDNEQVSPDVNNYDLGRLAADRKSVVGPVAAATAATTTACVCRREVKIADIGFDIAGNVVQRDVGQCTGRAALRVRHSGNRGAKNANKRRCLCAASRVRREHVYLLEGGTLRENEVVEECAPLAHDAPCQRTEKTLVLMDGTSYRTEVDVGACAGRCPHSNSSCKPLRNKTISVDGPNGGVCVNSVVECACAGECYRMRHVDVFTDTIWNSTRNSSVQLQKEIDIGRCVGQCDVSAKQQCVMWDRKDSRKCVMSLSNRHSRCVPSSYDSHVVTAANGHLKTVLSIAQCSCT